MIKSLFPSNCGSISETSAHLNVEPLEERMMLSSVQIFAAGSAGGEEIELVVKGQEVAWYTIDNGGGQLSEFNYQTSETLTASDIEIRFSNDFYDPANGIDLNLTVDRIVIDGQTFDTGATDVYSIGTYDGPNMVSGFGLGETLYSNGRFSFGQDRSEGSELTVYALGLRAEERFNVVIGDPDSGQLEVVASISTENQIRGLTGYTIELDRQIEPGEVRVEFTNDLYVPEKGIDRNLVIDRIELDGVTYQTEDGAVFSTGVYVPGSGVTSGFLRSETLHVNGYFQFAESGDTAPPVVTIGALPEDITEPFGQPNFSIIIADDAPRFPSELAIEVIGPAGQELSVREIFGGNVQDGSNSLFVGYGLNLLGGPLSSADNGVYEIRLIENTIFDAAGNFAPAALLGTFNVNI